MGARNLNTGAGRRTKLGMELERSAKEILAHLKGDVRLPTRRIVLPDEVDVKRIRTRAGMSQAEFARAFCIQSENPAGMGAGTEKTRRHDPRLPRGYRQEPRGGVGRAGVLNSLRPAVPRWSTRALGPGPGGLSSRIVSGRLA